MPVRLDLERMIIRGLVPKQAMNIIMCHLVKRMVAEQKAAAPGIRHRFLHITYTENFRMKNRYILVSPKGKALCLLKTQFAKKPKNPV